MDTKDIKRMFSSNGNSHALSDSINRMIGRSPRSSFTESIRQSLGRSSRSSSSSSNVALPLLIGIGAVALIGAGLSVLMDRSSGQGLMSRVNGLLDSGSAGRPAGKNYQNVHGTAGAVMPEPQANG